MSKPNVALPAFLTDQFMQLSLTPLHPTFFPLPALVALRSIRIYTRYREARQKTTGSTPAFAQDLFLFWMMNWGGGTMASILLAAPPLWIYSLPMFTFTTVLFPVLWYTPLGQVLSAIPTPLWVLVDGLVKTMSAISAVNTSMAQLPQFSIFGAMFICALNTGGGSFPTSTFGMFLPEWKISTPAMLKGGDPWDFIDFWVGAVIAVVYTTLIGSPTSLAELKAGKSQHFFALSPQEAALVTFFMTTALYAKREQHLAAKSKKEVKGKSKQS
jgi:hypothetical protein